MSVWLIITIIRVVQYLVVCCTEETAGVGKFTGTILRPAECWYRMPVYEQETFFVQEGKKNHCYICMGCVSVGILV